MTPFEYEVKKFVFILAVVFLTWSIVEIYRFLYDPWKEGE